MPAGLQYLATCNFLTNVATFLQHLAWSGGFLNFMPFRLINLKNKLLGKTYKIKAKQYEIHHLHKLLPSQASNSGECKEGKDRNWVAKTFA